MIPVIINMIIGFFGIVVLAIYYNPTVIWFTGAAIILFCDLMLVLKYRDVKRRKGTGMTRSVPLSEGENITPAKGRRKKKQYPVLYTTGKPIRFRAFQKLTWRVLALALGVGIVAGLYWYVLQQNYHNILPFLPKNASLKNWWDDGMGGLIHSPNWSNGIWRHGVRDKAEPEMWAIVGGILFGATLPGKPLRLIWVGLASIVMLALVIAGALGITWFTAFGPGKHLPDPFSIQDIILGLLVGQSLHFLWMPVASSIRYHLTRSAGASGHTPLWVTLPLAPPGMREGWSELKRQGKLRVKVTEKVDKFKQSRLVVPVLALLFLIVAVTGDLAKYGFAHGLHVALLNP